MISDHPREHGVAPDDVTSSLPNQKVWGPDRERNWPDILYRLERRELPVPDYHVGNLVHNGRVVLDLENRPVRDFVDLPATLSTEFSGQHMEAICRLDPLISHSDFRARMPKTRRIGRGGQTVRPSYSLSAIGMRMTQFRQEHGLISWTKREGSDNIKDALISKLPQHNIDSNTTRGVLPPSLVTQADARSRNKGKHSARAGRRALPEQERQKRLDKETEKLTKLREAEVESQQQARVQVSTKRKRAGQASPDNDEVEVKKRCKVSSPPEPLRSTLGIPLLPSPQPCQSVPAPQGTRKRSRDDSWSENHDEHSNTKRPCRRSASPPQKVEEGDSASVVDDTTQNVVKENTSFNDVSWEDIGSFGDVLGSAVAPKVLVVPEVFAAPEVQMVPEAPLTTEAHMTSEAPAIRGDNRESEGASPLEFAYNVIAEEFQFPSLDEDMTLEEILQRDLDQLDCEDAYQH